MFTVTWMLPFVDVARCSDRGGDAAVICGKRCLADSAATALARAA